MKMPEITQSPMRAAELLRAGRLVAIPTETVYGLAADALNAESVARIFEAKDRPAFDPLIVHVADVQQVESCVQHFPPAARKLAEAFWPGPLTIVLPRSPRIPDLVTAGLPGVGIRIPNHPLALQTLRLAQVPLAAPSANRFGGISPTLPAHVVDSLGDRIDAVLDGGPCTVGVESTVISLMDKTPTLLRHGGTSLEDLQAVVGELSLARPDPSLDDAAQPSPGMLSRHYAPNHRLIVVDARSAEPIAPLAGKDCVLLLDRPREVATGFSHVEILSQDGSLRVCAAGFFAALRALDARRPDVIITVWFPNEGLGVALNDRLRRASCKTDASPDPTDQ